MSKKLQVLMYGWEFPPYVSGGLGVACYAIVQELIKQNIDLKLVLPFTVEANAFLRNNCDVQSSKIYPLPTEVQLYNVKTSPSLNPYPSYDATPVYQSEETLEEFLLLLQGLHFPEEIKKLVGHLITSTSNKLSGRYVVNLLTEVFRYAALAGRLSQKIAHQVIYAHDWLTVLAGIEAKYYSHAPLVLHIHALEIDRSEGLGNQQVYAIEKYGMEQADQIIAVSQYTKERIVKYYHIEPNKISVVHNGVSLKSVSFRVKPSFPVVSFVGRLTYQKGPYFFLEVANRILAKKPDAQFVLAGTGDLYASMIEHVASLKIGVNVHFTGFLNEKSVKELYELSSVYVMPSISEPFGLTALEAAAYGIPVVISKQSGAKEVLKHALVADFWDVEDLSNKIISLLCHPSLASNLVDKSREDLKVASWGKSVKKIIQVYYRGMK